MAGYDDHQTEEEYIAATKKRRESEMGTKELVEMARSLAAQIDPMLIGGRDAALLRGLADAIERLERERDEQRECKEHARKCCDEAAAEAATLRTRVAQLEEALTTARGAIWNGCATISTLSKIDAALKDAQS